MTLLHALADTGWDGLEAYVDCTCGMRTWGCDDSGAWESFTSHKRLAQLSEYQKDPA
jgi:hypothetical protein